MSDLTKLTNEVRIGDRVTTIFDEFRRQRGDQPTIAPALRVFSGNGSGSPSDRYSVSLWDAAAGEAVSFDLSEDDFISLRSQ